MPFDDDEIVKPPVRKIGVKKTNAPPAAGSTASIKDDFEKQVDAQHAKIEQYKSDMWDLAIKYKSFIENKTLPENRGPIFSNIEKEVLDKLIDLSCEMNEDATQPESAGSIALCLLLLKCMLFQRDIISSLYFKVDQLEKKINKQGIRE